MTCGKDHRTYDLSLAILHEEIEHEVWFSEFRRGAERPRAAEVRRKFALYRQIPWRTLGKAALLTALGCAVESITFLPAFEVRSICPLLDRNGGLDRIA
jgi:hypothetical protein